MTKQDFDEITSQYKLMDLLAEKFHKSSQKVTQNLFL